MTVSTDEWLEADGLGGFASGTVSGVRTRRYHALLLVAMTPPTGRLVLVNGVDAWVETRKGRFDLSSQYYAPDVMQPDSSHRVESFKHTPWPQWTYRLEDGTRLRHELFVPHQGVAVALSWKLLDEAGPVSLFVRPFLSGRDYHGLHHENAHFRFETDTVEGRLAWNPYPGLPPAVVCWNGQYQQRPDWYRSFLYCEERQRGLDCIEDLGSPGVLSWELGEGEALCLLSTKKTTPPPRIGLRKHFASLRSNERKRRGGFRSALHRAADAYLVRRDKGKTIVAGYPWFTDWGRDTFIALRGLCIATGKLDEAKEILLVWADSVSDGMLPNRFADGPGEAEYNSVDASLWYVVAVHDYFHAMERVGQAQKRVRRRLQETTQEILNSYRVGTRYQIHCDRDGLLAAGEPGVQLTWMDAKVGEWVVTPRIGKPVEIQALWINALRFATGFDKEWETLSQQAVESFRSRFWNRSGNFLYDVVDVDHRRGTQDATFRPNQIFAVGGLPTSVLETEQARIVVDAVQERLMTPLGLRSLAPEDADYKPHYVGGPTDRDGAYHRGTVWPWLMGPFVEAWVRVRGGTKKSKKEARSRFLGPLLEQLETGGLGHLPEIADGDAPHTPRGCPFQAWSVAEALRLDREVL